MSNFQFNLTDHSRIVAKRSHGLTILGGVILALLLPITANAECLQARQCDWCQQSQEYEMVALAENPGPIGYGTSLCEIYVVNFSSEIVKKYNTHKTVEPGFSASFAIEQLVAQSVESTFESIFEYIEDIIAEPQDIGLPIDFPIESGYDIPGDSSATSAVNNYILSNHPFFSGLWNTLGILYSQVDHFAGTNFGQLLSVKVHFPDGSQGIFQVEVVGQYMTFEPVEGTFYDIQGNEIMFAPSDYAGSTGSFLSGSLASLDFLFSRMGYSVIMIDNGNHSCSWECTADKCTVTC